MKFGEEWLRSLIKISFSHELLCEKFKNIGLEVSFYKNLDKKFDGVVIGQVINKKKHPIEIDYYIYNVYINKIFKIFIISKNNNIFIGDKIPVAIEGSTIRKNFLIKKKYVKGYLSEGIFCSYSDLYFEKNNNNYIKLPNNASVGLSFSSYIFFSDFFLNISIPTNRPDLNSIFGIVRELCFSFNYSNNIFENFKNKEVFNFLGKVNIKKTNNKLSYIYRVINNISLKRYTPFWIKERLRRCGFVSDCVLKNIIQYVFIETGIWFHIFDLDFLEGDLCISHISDISNLKIKNIEQKNIFKDSILLLNNNNILSSEDMSMTYHANITNNTENIFIGAIFYDSSYVYSRNIDIFNKKIINDDSKYNINSYKSDYFLNYLTKIITDCCSGKISFIKKYFLKEKKNKKICINFKKINKVIGRSFSLKEILNLLVPNGFIVYYKNKKLFITPPKWRSDIYLEEEIIGEIVRLYDSENIFPLPPKESCTFFDNITSKFSILDIKNILSTKGYFEIISYSFIDPFLQRFFFPNSFFLSIKNPISIDMSVMRCTLYIGLLKCVSYNQKRQNNSIRLLESGLCFFSNKIAPLFCTQEEMLSGVVNGYISDRSWNSKIRKFDFYDIKGDVEYILEKIGKLKDIKIVNSFFPGFCKKQNVDIYYNKEKIGHIGLLDEKINNFFDIKGPTILFELFWNKISNKPSSLIKEFSKLPKIKRDISIIVPNYIVCNDLINLCKKTLFKYSVNIYVYDIYYGNGIPIDKKSISISFVFESFNVTLKDDDINYAILKCVKILQNKFQAILRD